jgi:hypothetical protein
MSHRKTISSAVNNAKPLVRIDFSPALPPIVRIAV